MEYGLTEVSQWLDAHKDNGLIIHKEEDGDFDQIELRLEKVSRGRLKEKDPDDYVPAETLLLHGDGTIIGEDIPAPLSQGVYEIPLTEGWKVEEIGNILHIQTDRASYAIQPKP